ncbi:MAG: LacI family transcriptional regulator [Ancrocorticia sp.]|jgi:DNA-binding LacI/PurR family transcriptional regulator|nr:LacI family transcriptional regulator [Ancrocorticia sp.]MCI1896411.1 LacI family transcriptional regulator [Ancrocorticia sp.]MCI1932481.1 LacI family transcriptional regulator [Ancrocorticia sp.]MCI1962606.1 LacI family transcriptional regulator [Ancrocorticia sp.]MCI2002465.1 LacI family transcriptional regulator [Ancrocorticia sp.]
MAERSRQGRQKTGPSIKDVAHLAGVSAQTVSRVSNGAHSVRPETRERVIAAMNQLGYSPNRAARALRNGTFGTIGVITQQLRRTGESLTTSAIVQAAEDNGYSVTLIQVTNPETDDLRHATFRISHQSIDGLIVVRAGHATYESLALPAGMPVAVSDSRMIGFFPSVTADQVQGTRDAVQHLLALGHRTVHHIAGAADSQPSVVRAATWRRTLEEAGISAPEPWHGNWTAHSGYQIGQRIALDPAITAVYCANDEMAFGLMRALYENGRHVPADVSVVGFDGIDLSEYASPPLTTVRQDFDQIGRELLQLLLEQIKGTHATRERVVVPTELIVRGSTAAPPH